MEKRIYKLAKILVLTLIILLGVVLGSFNLNFPSIGYHNMNENEYLTTAHEMQKAGDYSSNRLYCYNIFEEPIERFHPQPPLISYQVILAWNLLDKNLWGPRLFNILFGALSILIIYFIAAILFKNPLPSFFSSFLLAIMPLAVFFSRQLQPESPAFFFMILSNLFYVRFISSMKKYNIFISGLALSAACFYRFNFFITVIPYLVCFPFKALLSNRKELLKTLLVFCLSASVLIIGIIWLKSMNRWYFTQMSGIKPFDIFTARYWTEHGRTIWWYAKQENFTIVYTILALLGICIAFFKRKNLLDKYIIGWGLAIIIYGMIYSKYLFQNNYSQMPFLILVSVSSVYTISSISSVVRKFFRRDLFLVFMLIAIIISAPLLYNSILRMHGTAFLGVDVAGKSLREFTRPGEYIFLSTHSQGYGIVRYSRRMAGWVKDLEGFKNKEKEFNIKYTCFYPIENLFQLKFTNLPLFEYIQNNYHIKEIGMTEEPLKLHYVILEKGEGQDIEASLGSLSGIKRIGAIYKSLERDRYIFFYSLTPVMEKPQDTE